MTSDKVTTDTENPKLQIRIDKYGKHNDKAPLREFDDRTGEFEYADPSLREKTTLRKDQNTLTDTLKMKQQGLRKHLKRKNLEDKMGKTGNSSTGEISEENKEVAKIQSEHAKIYIKRYRNR